MTGIEANLESACAQIPGVVSGALVLVSERLLLGSVGAGGALDREPLVRLAARLVSERSPLSTPSVGAPFVEYAFVNEDQFVVILRGRRFPELALALACTRDVNLALIMSTTRLALRDIEAKIDSSTWEA